MKNNRLRILLLATASVALVMAATIIVVAQEHPMHKGEMTMGKSEIKVGKKGEVQFASETKVGDLMLKPGRYAMQHRVDGANHFIHFTELSARNPNYRSSPTSIAHPGEVPCKLEPLQSKVSQTTVELTKEDGSNRVNRVRIAGENVAHLF